MKYKTTNDAGEEIEVEAYSEEELNSKLDEVKKEYDSKMIEKDTTLSNLAKEKEELEKKIGGVKEDHPNFKVLKDALDKKDNDIKTLREDLENDRKSRRDSFLNSIIVKASKGNEDFEKKVKFHLDNTLVGLKDSTDQEIKTKVEAAIKLSLDTHESKSILDNIMGDGGGKGFVKSTGGDAVEFSPREKAIGAKLGITAEDYKKYGPKLSKK